MAVPLIRFVCMAEKHYATLNEGSTTVHDTEWAYCFSNIADGHDWQRIAEPAEVSALHADRLVHRRPNIVLVSTSDTPPKGKSKVGRG
jgi:hypothetical protein